MPADPSERPTTDNPSPSILGVSTDFLTWLVDEILRQAADRVFSSVVDQVIAEDPDEPAPSDAMVVAKSVINQADMFRVYQDHGDSTSTLFTADVDFIALHRELLRQSMMRTTQAALS